jgi:NitT/TauT family transport system substrate-binding protein
MFKRRRARSTGLGTIILIAFALSPAAAADKVSIGVTGAGSAINWPIYIAQARGIYKALDLDVDVIPVDSSAGVLQQLVGGSTNFGVSSPSDAVRAIDKGAPLEIIRVEEEAAAYEVFVKPTISGFADLKGKIVMMGGAKDITRYYFEHMGEPQGLEPGTFDLVYAGATAQRFAALQSGSIDATILAAPFNFRARAAAFKSLGFPLTDDTRIPFAVISTNKAWAEANQSIVTRFMNGFAKGVEVFYDDKSRDEVIDIFQKASNSNPDDAAKTYDMYRSLPTFDKVGAVESSGIETVINQLKHDGELEGPADINRFVDVGLSAAPSPSK